VSGVSYGNSYARADPETFLFPVLRTWLRHWCCGLIGNRTEHHGAGCSYEALLCLWFGCIYLNNKLMVDVVCSAIVHCVVSRTQRPVWGIDKCKGAKHRSACEEHVLFQVRNNLHYITIHYKLNCPQQSNFKDHYDEAVGMIAEIDVFRKHFRNNGVNLKSCFQKAALKSQKLHTI